MTKVSNTYPPGYSPVRRTFQSKRTAGEYAKYLLPHLKEDMRILDCGCGPGSITIGFAEIASKGFVIGIDREETDICYAQDVAKSLNITNIIFKKQKFEALEFADNSFDVVHAHALLDYFKDVSDVNKVLVEMARVCKSGGLIAFRQADWSKIKYYPLNDSCIKMNNRFTNRIINSYGVFKPISDFETCLRRLGISDITHGISQNIHDANDDLIHLWAYLFVATMTSDADVQGIDLLIDVRDFCNWAVQPEAKVVETWNHVIAIKP